MTCRQIAIVVLTIAGFGVQGANAQSAIVYYDHRPGDSAIVPRVSYLMPGDRTSRAQDSKERHAGLPPSLRIPQGSSVCMVVEHANTLLYTYTAASKSITTEAPAGLASLLSTIVPIISSIEKSSNARGYLAASRDAEADLLQYARQVRHIADIASNLDDVRNETDAEPGLARAAHAADSLARVAELENVSAAKLFATHRSDTVFVLLRDVQTAAFNHIAAESQEIAAAASASDPTFCAVLDDSRVRTTLAVTRKFKVASGELARRPARDSVFSVVSEPLSTRVFELVPAAVLSFDMQGRRRFGIDNGVVKGRADKRPIFNPGVLALGRVGGPLWVATGVAKGVDLYPDLFVGATLRAGASVVGTNIVVGAGLSVSKVVVGLSDGREGAAVPSDATDVQQIVKREYRAGVGVIFSVSGLSFARMEKR
jgi:hypothetical protein